MCRSTGLQAAPSTGGHAVRYGLYLGSEWNHQSASERKGTSLLPLPTPTYRKHRVISSDRDSNDCIVTLLYLFFLRVAGFSYLLHYRVSLKRELFSPFDRHKVDYEKGSVEARAVSAQSLGASRAAARTRTFHIEMTSRFVDLIDGHFKVPLAFAVNSYGVYLSIM